jgi:hypothetical protein
MMHSQGTAAAVAQALAPASYAAGANNGPWIDCRADEGEIVFDIGIGAVTGSTVVKVQDATDGAGAGVADLATFTTASISSANSVAKIVVPAGAHRGFLRLVATVTTGPVFHGANKLAHPKYV